MPNNFYEDEADDQTDGLTSVEELPDDSTSKDSIESDTQTALLPKSFFMGKDKRPGDTCKIKVVKAFDDEIQVSYVPEKEGEDIEESVEEMGDADMMMAGGEKSYYE